MVMMGQRGSWMYKKWVVRYITEKLFLVYRGLSKTLGVVRIDKRRLYHLVL